MHKYGTIVNNIDLIQRNQALLIQRKARCISGKGLLIVTII
jgi:hypothetical protein